MCMCYVHIFKCNYVIKLNLKKLETKTGNSLTTIKRAQRKAKDSDSIPVYISIIHFLP